MSNKSVGYTDSANYSCLEDLEQTYTMKTITPVTLAYCGRENCAPEWTFGPYVREHYVIHVVKAGCGTYSLRNREFRLTAGQMFLIYPGEVTLYKADAEDPWSYSWIGFSGYKAESIVEEIGFTKENPVVTLESAEEICAAIDRILETEVSEMLGSEVDLHVNCGGDDVVMVLQTVDLDQDVSIGAKVNFTTQPRLIQLFDKETGNNLIWYDAESVAANSPKCKDYDF